MQVRPHRSHRVAAVVGLLAGVALLLAAVLDGGMGSPTRSDLVDPAGAALTAPGDIAAATLAPREDHPLWGHMPASGRLLAIAAAALGMVALVAARAARPVPLVATLGPRHRAPALRTVRHRGPPVVR